MDAENDLQAIRLLLQRLSDTPPHAEVLRVTMQRDHTHDTGAATRIVAFVAKPHDGWRQP